MSASGCLTTDVVGATDAGLITDRDEVLALEACFCRFTVFECVLRAVVDVVSHSSTDEADRSGTVTPIAFLKGTLRRACVRVTRCVGCCLGREGLAR